MLSVPEVRWASAALGLFLLGALLQLLDAPTATWWVAYLACYVAGGWEPGWVGLQALRDRTLDVDLLMVVAAGVAASIGQVFDGALLIVIFATSGALEAVATRRTRDSVSALLDLAPDQATRITDDGELVVAAADLQPGDTVLVRPGERIGADARVIDGSSEVDQAWITGEPLPVLKTVGSDVFAGTVNGTGALWIEVSRPATESVVARIVTMVEAASATKARTQLFIEKIEQRYSVAMVGATLLLFFVPLALGAALQPTLLRAITFMIVASPCAVVLATMPPLLSAIANAGRHGVLVKSAVVMEQFALTDTIGFDKTGTLTAGTPRISDIAVAAGWTQEEVLRLAAAAEVPSEHPLGTAVVAAARERGLTDLPAAEGFRSTPGRGVEAVVHGRSVLVGSPAMLAGSARTVDSDTMVASAQENGRTAVVVLVDGRLAAVMALSDRLRSDALRAVADLRALTDHEPVLLTGDGRPAAARLGREVGISDICAELLPADKVDVVQRLQQAGQRVLLVGDGVNDAPAMAAAHLGVAMGRQGADLALETADAVVVQDDLSTLAPVIGLSRRARRVVVANLVIAAVVIAALVAWDLTGTLPLPIGVAGHETSTVIVGLNGLRLLRAGAWRAAGTPRPPRTARRPRTWLRGTAATLPTR